tara:strand:+ start:329 stop:1216 length:888 start_codon:yes stop_codon:yes gene_type:complete
MTKNTHKDLLEETEFKRDKAKTIFKELRNKICKSLELIEADTYLSRADKAIKNKFYTDNWDRPGGGGGLSSILTGNVFEKAGVHVSTVYGKMPEDLQVSNIDKNEKLFWASGISVIIHPLSPYIPSVHLNLRMLVTDSFWYGGGADITPMLKEKRDTKDKDTVLFHSAMENACFGHPGADYKKMREDCDKYFLIKHRNENRGSGGIFFDHFKSENYKNDLTFMNNVGQSFIKSYEEIVKNNIELEWNDKQRNEQLFYRGRYVEFNLMYDKGTIFGLKTGGNINSILSSLPPLVRW